MAATIEAISSGVPIRPAGISSITAFFSISERWLFISVSIKPQAMAFTGIPEGASSLARAFVKAGADGIMIHSRKKDPAEILEFCDKFRAENKITPIVVVPSSFNTITEAELAEHGVNIVIYANQLTRSAFPAMQQTAEEILKYHRAKEVDDRLMPIKQIITLIDEI